MIKNMTFAVVMSLLLALIIMDITNAKEYAFSITERIEKKSIHCVTKKHNGNNVLLCAEMPFELGQIMQPMRASDSIPTKVVPIKATPVKKPVTAKPTVSSPFGNLSRGGQSIPGGLGR